MNEFMDFVLGGSTAIDAVFILKFFVFMSVIEAITSIATALTHVGRY